MSDLLPKDLRDQLAAARIQSRRKSARRAVHIGDEAFAILDMTEEGFAVEAERTPPLRGLVDIFEGPRHLYQALIVAAARDGDVMRYDFKRNTAAMTRAPLDFAQRDTAPAGLLPKA